MWDSHELHWTTEEFMKEAIVRSVIFWFVDLTKRSDGVELFKNVVWPRHY